MKPEEAEELINQHQEHLVDPSVAAPNAAQLALAHKVVRGKETGSDLTEHPVTKKPCTVAEREAALAELASK